MPRRQTPSASAQLPLAAWGLPPGPLRNPDTGRFESASQREQRAAVPLPNRGATPASSTALPARSGPLRNPDTGRFENASQREQRTAEPLPNRGATPASSTALPARSGPLRNPYTGRFENADSRRFRERQTELAELAGMGGESDDNDPYDLGEEEY